MTRLRLSPSASVTPAGDLVLLRSDLGTFAVRGADTRAFLDHIVPLLDGSRDAAEIAAALHPYSPRSVEALLDLLDKRGLLDRVGDEIEGEGEDDRLRGQEEFLRRWAGGSGEAARSLRSAHVAIVGLSPWADVAARAIAASGVAAVDLVGPPGARREALLAEIAAAAPRCRVEARGAPAERASLWVVGASLDDDQEIARIARLAHEARTRTLWASLAGAAAVMGPLVKPGLTACRVCMMDEALGPPRPGAANHPPFAPGVIGTLGAALALSALQVLSGYTESSLAGQVSIQDLRTFESRRHMLVRVPWCRVCGARPSS